MPLLLSLLFLGVALPADAAVYKCANDGGGVVYQDTACAPGRELRNLDLDPATVSVVPGTPVPTGKSPPASAAKPARVKTGTVKVKDGSASERKFLREGMSDAEVILKVGRPDVESKGRGKEGRRWSYLPTAGDPDTITTLTFTGGRVAHVDRKLAR
jgi:hypothetical protein